MTDEGKPSKTCDNKLVTHSGPETTDFKRLSVEEKLDDAVLDPDVVDFDGPNDPKNPMNWSSGKKAAAITMVTMVTLLSPIGSTISSSAAGDIMVYFNTTNETLLAFATTIYLLGYAFGPIMIAPLSEMYGRASLYKICIVLFLIFNVACAVANNLSTGSIADMVPREKRAGAMAAYVIGAVLGPSVGPIVGGYLTPARRVGPGDIGGIFVPIGLFWYAWTAEGKLYWIVPIIGTGFISGGMVITYMTSTLYLVDAYTVYVASVTASSTIFHCLFATFLRLAGPAMYGKLGIGWGTSILGFIAVAFIPLPFIFYIYGQRLQQNQLENRRQATSVAIPSPLPVSLPQPAVATTGQGDLLAQIQNLRKLAEDLEKRVTDQTTTASLQQHRNGSNFSLPESPSSFASLRVDTGAPVSSGFGPVSEELVARLKCISIGQGSYEPVDVDDLVFRVDHIRAIPLERSLMMQPGRSSGCVLLPQHDEARVLVDKFINSASYIHHVVHHPSLPGVIDELYRQIARQEPVKLGHVVLLFSIVASVTHVWGPHDDIGYEDFLFSSSAQANAQTAFWIKETYDILNGGSNGPPIAQETIQGIIILSFLLCNLEGVSLRYRSLISTGLLLGREMGLQRTDHKSNVTVPNTISVEIGRRVWWFMAKAILKPCEFL
ncbi:uncharacterized protein GIQ15_03022 [Arthroderma uncinatum]|uniref:uncharacterized protein n=1 Tax=Arthroderma uncinatum TaxID=74035 RepID=UPI00144AF983|nr:uncharacterized protein GIQ15_03022 [Arthroderma uncinatum]KAF3483698.1 hypothetical protein GIQ15_03022 [Arthroderma uncinatum]